MLSNVLELTGLAAFVAAAVILTLSLTASVLAAVGVGLLVVGVCLVLVAWGLSAPVKSAPTIVRIPSSALTNDAVDEPAARVRLKALTNEAVEADRAA